MQQKANLVHTSFSLSYFEGKFRISIKHCSIKLHRNFNLKQALAQSSGRGGRFLVKSLGKIYLRNTFVGLF